MDYSLVALLENAHVLKLVRTVIPRGFVTLKERHTRITIEDVVHRNAGHFKKPSLTRGIDHILKCIPKLGLPLLRLDCNRPPYKEIPYDNRQNHCQ